MSENEEYTTVRLPSKIYDCIEIKVVELYIRLKITKVPINPLIVASQLGFIVKNYSSLPSKASKKSTLMTLLTSLHRVAMGLLRE